MIIRVNLSTSRILIHIFIIFELLETGFLIALLIEILLLLLVLIEIDILLSSIHSRRSILVFYYQWLWLLHVLLLILGVTLLRSVNTRILSGLLCKL